MRILRVLRVMRAMRVMSRDENRCWSLNQHLLVVNRLKMLIVENITKNVEMLKNVGKKFNFFRRK